MAERSEIYSNTVGMLAAGCVIGLFMLLTPPKQLPAGPEGPPVEVSLEQEEEPKQEPVQQPEMQQAPPPVQETEKIAEKTETAKAEEATPTKEPDPMPDPEAEAAAQEKAKQAEAAAAEKQTAFFGCLQKHFAYPRSREALKKKLKGTVVVRITTVGGEITKVEIATSSGSSILDDAAKASALKSGCGKVWPEGEMLENYIYN
jgi:periplasmic protein TonB